VPSPTIVLRDVSPRLLQLPGLLTLSPLSSPTISSSSPGRSPVHPSSKSPSDSPRPLIPGCEPPPSKSTSSSSALSEYLSFPFWFPYPFLAPILLPGPRRADPFPPARCVPFDPFDRSELLDLNCDSGFDCLRSRGVTPPPFVGPWRPPAGAIRSDARRGGAVLLELVVPRRRLDPRGETPPVRLLEATGLEEEEKDDALRVSRRRRGTSRCELGDGGFDGDEGTGGESIQAWAMYPGWTCSGVDGGA
jgi:hypothetical protein